MESFVRLDASSDEAASADEGEERRVRDAPKDVHDVHDHHRPQPTHTQDTTAKPYDGPSIELRLHEEVIDLVDAFRPTTRERALRTAAAANLTAIVRTLWKAARVHTFGSFDTGVFLPSSDVDLVVLNAGGASKPQQVAGLRQIEWALREKNVGHSLDLISKAKVPIVKYIDVETGVPVDGAFTRAVSGIWGSRSRASSRSTGTPSSWNLMTGTNAEGTGWRLETSRPSRSCSRRTISDCRICHALKNRKHMDARAPSS